MPTTKKMMAVLTPDSLWEAFRPDTEGFVEVNAGIVGTGWSVETVQTGWFVWVIPLNLTPNQARYGDGYTLELKEILAIYQNPINGKFLYECRHYIRGPEVEHMVVDFSDPTTKALLNCLGAPDEYVWTDIHSYVWANRIEDLVDVLFMDPRASRFCPLLPDQPYTRYDLELETRLNGTVLGVGARRAPLLVCKPGSACKEGGTYLPHIHHMRWCQACETWFHLDCLEEGRLRSPLLASAHLSEEPSANWHLWQDALNAAITRIPRTDNLYYAAPFTLETILYAIRQERTRFWLTADVELPDFEEFVLGVMEHQGLRPSYRQPLYADLLDHMDFMKDGMMYRCGNVHCTQWI